MHLLPIDPIARRREGHRSRSGSFRRVIGDAAVGIGDRFAFRRNDLAELLERSAVGLPGHRYVVAVSNGIGERAYRDRRRRRWWRWRRSARIVAAAAAAEKFAKKRAEPVANAADSAKPAERTDARVIAKERTDGILRLEILERVLVERDYETVVGHKTPRAVGLGD